jgi:hypothetical protein
MAVQIICPSCSKAMRLPESVVGQTIKCPRCQKRICVQKVVDKPRTDVGFEIVDERICPQCHRAIDQNETNCSHCSFNLRTEKKRQKEFGDASESAVIGDKNSGTFTECTLQRVNERWILLVDRWLRHRQTRMRLNLDNFAEVRTNFYSVDDDSQSITVQLVDRDGRAKSLGPDLPVKWLLDSLQFKAGLNIRRV